ncbi:TolC family protein [Adhaeretor mobilis]|uniref:Outer membrane efflux protein n=1 Tax=Adhaeretor mobilis TaxID=1930276 RepID=A0A517MRC4_9BACT|nr:TolC family protein [Adhaeretor mobilis]QDS97431.1 Outer membrane efflux protein [Adhaeretor mobilis]
MSPLRSLALTNSTSKKSLALLLCVLTFATGCQPIQPVFFREDGDLSHYLDVATEIEYPDVCAVPLEEVTSAQAPLTLENAENFDVWDLTMEQATRLTLQNSNVMRQLGGRIADGGQNIAATTPETISASNGANLTTTYDAAIVETGTGTGTGSAFSGTGVEAALSEFDAQLDSSLTWNYNDRPQNFGLASAPGFFAPQFRQDLGIGTLGVTKSTADGSTFEIRNNTNYEQNNNGSRTQPSDWTTNFEAAFSHPLLQGRGTQYNRIAGLQSFQQAAGGLVNNIDGVMIARIRHDITLADFEGGVRNLMRDVEDAYWELYFAYRDLDSRKIGRNSALETWRKIKALQEAGGEGGEADKEAQARSQYYLFTAQLETALTNLFRVENRLRYIMGITHSDGRLIRPIDEPTTAQVHFDWASIHIESLSRRVEIRRQKWQVKRRELELIASRNHLLPRLDLGGRYRWLGAGDQLLRSDRNGIAPFADGSNAFEVLTGGDYQEWQVDLQFTLPIGFRRALSGVRHHQLLLARERAVLQDLELEISHQLGDSVRDVAHNYGVVKTNFNRRVATQDQVEAVEAIYDSGSVTLDLLLEAQRQRAEAESAYYRSLVDFNRAIMRVHYRKGSLLEYNGVYLAEGPWPGKAQFDALRRARQRDGSHQINYGYTRPSVISRGPQAQVGVQNQNPTMSPAMSTPMPLPANAEYLPIVPENETNGATDQGNGTDALNNLQEAIPAPAPDPEAATWPQVPSAVNEVLQATHLQPLPQPLPQPALTKQTSATSPETQPSAINYGSSQAAGLSGWISDNTQPSAASSLPATPPTDF